MDENLRAVADFLKADNNVRDALINNLMTQGEIGREEMGYEVSKIVKRVGVDLSAKEIASLLEKTFGYGFDRYIGEYDNRKLSELDLVNCDSMVDQHSIDMTQRRRKYVNDKVECLSCSGNTKPVEWDDFVNRSCNAVRDIIDNKYGTDAARKFEYYVNYDVRDVLNIGLVSTLRKAHDRTIDEVSYLNNATRKLEGEVEKTVESSQKIDYAAMFK